MGKMTIQQMILQLAGGMGTSIQIFLVTLVFSLPLGLVVAFGRMSRNKFLQAIVKAVSYTHLGRLRPGLFHEGYLCLRGCGKPETTKGIF